MKTILATGALLKSSFSLSPGNNVFISQYLGNTDSYEAQSSYNKVVQHLLKVFNTSPEVIIADKHPDYFSYQYARELSLKKQIPFVTVQHHRAHFAAVLAENNLLDKDAAVLGVIWDGTGLGDDGNIWGGEFFKYENKAMTRCYHFDYFPLIASDKMAKEPRLSALAVYYKSRIAGHILKDKFTEKEWGIFQKILQQQNHLQCSSVGRIFDAVASMLNILDRQTYEGEAAILLEERAADYFKKNGWEFSESYFDKDEYYYHVVPTGTFFNNIIVDLKKKLPTEYIAAKFHYSLVHLIDLVSIHAGLNKIAFSGGVFQNSVLVDLCKIHLSKTRKLFFHQELPPNDENISFGQLVYYDNNITNQEIRSFAQQAFINNTEQIIHS